MKGLTLLKNIKRGVIKNGDNLVYKNEGNPLDGCIVYLSDNELFFNIFGQKKSVTSRELLNGEFLSIKEYQQEQKIMEWLENNMQVNNLFYFKQDLHNKNIINCYYKHTNLHFCEFYKNKIDMLITNQEEVI